MTPAGQPTGTVGHPLGALSSTVGIDAIDRPLSPVDTELVINRDLEAVLEAESDADAEEQQSRPRLEHELRWLTHCPAGDVNFRSALERADKYMLEIALIQIDRKPGKLGACKAIRARLKKLAKEAATKDPATVEKRQTRLNRSLDRAASEKRKALETTTPEVRP